MAVQVWELEAELEAKQAACARFERQLQQSERQLQQSASQLQRQSSSGERSGDAERRLRLADMTIRDLRSELQVTTYTHLVSHELLHDQKMNCGIKRLTHFA